MFIPKWLVRLLFFVGAASLAWIAKDLVDDVMPKDQQPAASVGERDSNDELVAALAGAIAQLSASDPPVVTLRVIDGEPAVGPTGNPADSTGAGAAGAPSGGSPGESTTGSALAPSVGAGSATGSHGLQVMSSTGAGGPQAPSLVTASGVAAAFPQPWGTSTQLGASNGFGLSTSPLGRFAVDRSVAGGNLGVSMSPGTAAAVGEHIVIAYDGSIVLVGDNGRLIGNTGAAGQGGVVALDSQASRFATSSTGTNGAAWPGGFPAWSPAPPLLTAPPLAAVSPAGWPTPYGPMNSPLGLLATSGPMDIAGLEDHSISVRGRRDIVTYDDSNVFIDRMGQINANTGDTDSGGLNAAVTIRSQVTGGPHCDDGCDDESIIQAEAGVFDEGDVAIDGDGDVVFAPDATTAEVPSDDDSLPTDTGDDEDVENDESDDGDVSDPVEPAETRQEADTDTGPTLQTSGTTGGQSSTAAGNAHVIGGDGYDDLSLRVEGDDHVVTYDDSNVVIGGTGPVNAQIGDSDTGGAVTSVTVDSEVSGGNSR